MVVNGKVRKERDQEERNLDSETTRMFWETLFGSDEPPVSEEGEGDETITVIEVENAVKCTTNGKAAGPDAVQGFWWKYLEATHQARATSFDRWMK